MSADMHTLLAAYRAGTLDPAQALALRELLQDPARAAAARAELDLSAALSVALDPVGGEGRLAALRQAYPQLQGSAARLASLRRRYRRSFAWWPLAAVGAAAALLLVVMLPALQPAAHHSTDTLQLERDGRRISLAAGAALQGQDVIESAGSVHLQLADDSRLQLEGGRLVVPSGDAAWQLTRGRLACRITPQQPGGSFGVATDVCRISVVGTAFTLDASPGQTRVQVSAGSVRMTHAAGSQLLAAGDHGLVTPQAWQPGIAEQLFACEASAPPSSLIGGRPVDLAGEQVLASEHGGRHDVYAITCEDQSGLWTVRGDEFIEIVYRLEGEPLWASVYLRNRDDGTAGDNSVDWTPEPGPRWQTRRIPIGAFRHVGETGAVGPSLTPGELVQNIRMQAGAGCRGALHLRSMRVLRR